MSRATAWILPFSSPLQFFPDINTRACGGIKYIRVWWAEGTFELCSLAVAFLHMDYYLSSGKLFR